jgi:uncharacterized tellurite resistance protein B-like protein
MARRKLIFALAKVIIAAAWADGRITNEEVNSLKDLLFQIPEMTARDWARLEIYLDSPIDEESRARLVADLQDALRTPRDRQLVLQRLQEIIAADGEVTEAERQVFAEIRADIERVDVSLIGQLGHLLVGPISRRSQIVSDAPNRELFLDDFMRNRIYYYVRMRMQEKNTELHIPETDLRKLSLAGGLLAQVAQVDREIKPSELEAIRLNLPKLWQVDSGAAALVAEVAAAEIGKVLDYYRLAREFFEATSEKERLAMLELMFAVAAADGIASYEEIEAIRQFANLLKLTHKQFIAAKLTLPPERRAS